LERKGEREREGEKGKEGGTVTRKEGGREGGGEGGEVWRDRERETDGQTLKNHLPNFQMGSAHANVYGAIDRAIGRANGVVLRCEKIREGGEVGRDRERVTDGQRQALATPICAPGFEHSTSINQLHNEAGDILQALEATFPHCSAAVPQAQAPADTKPRAGDCAGHTHVGVNVFSNVLACHELAIYSIGMPRNMVYIPLACQGMWYILHWHAQECGIYCIGMPRNVVYIPLACQGIWYIFHWHAKECGIYSIGMNIFSWFDV
jgi:hypothetical protein